MPEGRGISASMQLVLLPLLLLFACVTARQGSAVDEIFTALNREEPASTAHREVDLANYHDKGTELCFRETAVCDEGFDDEIASEFDCCGGRSRDMLVGGADQPAGLCVINNEDTNINTPSSDILIVGAFTATCYLGKGSEQCDMKGLENTVVAVQGVTVASDTVVFDEDPTKYPLRKCNGENVGRRQSRFNSSSETKLHGGRKAEERRQQRKAKTPKAPKRAPPSGDATFWEGPAYIFSGVAYAHKRNSPGNLQTGFFEVARPFRQDPMDDPLFQPITAAVVGNRRVYTPFEYRLDMAPVMPRKQYK